MPPRKAKKVPTPSGSTNSESDVVATPSVKPAIAPIVENIEKIRTTRSDIRKGIEQDHAKAVVDLRARIAKHYQAEMSKRSTLMAKHLERLAKAVEQKRACEEAIRNLTVSLSEEGAHLAVLMNAVHTGRGNAVRDTAASYRQKKSK